MGTKLLKNTVGRKLIMAFTGLCMVGFVVVHLIGNTGIFLGPEVFNLYAAKLKSLGPLLWLFRGGLLLVLGVHIFFGVTLTLENWKAKPDNYAVKKRQASTFSSETMIYSGLLILAFILFHLLHFTVGAVNADLFHAVDPAGRHDVFHMVVANFQMLVLVAIYSAAMGILFFHVRHGVHSLIQTFGLNNDRTLVLFKKAGLGVGAVLALGFVSIPFLIYLGIVKL
jgi:succinate dehydrogenase / fumarate reductase cytochrome b subunit